MDEKESSLPHFAAASRLVLALQDEQIAANMTAEELLAAADKFFDGLKSTAQGRAIFLSDLRA